MLKFTIVHNTHTFYVLVFLTKHIFGFKDKNYDIYLFLIYWTYVHMQHASMCLNIMFLYFNKF